MLRFIFSCLLYTLIARWGYKEIELLYPRALPFIDKTVQKIELPTHNHWSREAFEAWVNKMARYAKAVSTALAESDTKN